MKPCTQPEEHITNTGVAPRCNAMVAGASGFPGRFFAGKLIEIGFRAGTVVRHFDRLGNAAGNCSEVTVAQMSRIDTLPGEFDGEDIAFSSVGILHFWRRPSCIDFDFVANRHGRHFAELEAASSEM